MLRTSPADTDYHRRNAEADKVKEQLSLNNDHQSRNSTELQQFGLNNWVYYSGMPNTVISRSGGCQNPCGDAKIPREFYSGMPNPLGYHIPCDTGLQPQSPPASVAYENRAIYSADCLWVVLSTAEFSCNSGT